MKITKLLLIITLTFISMNSASAFTQKELNEYNLYKTQYKLTLKKLKVLKKNAKNYKQKARLAKKQGKKAAFKRYIAKLDDASFQRELHIDDLDELSLRIDEFDLSDEIKDVELIALN